VLNLLPKLDHSELFNVAQRVQRLIDRKSATIIPHVPDEVWKRIIYDCFLGEPIPNLPLTVPLPPLMKISDPFKTVTREMAMCSLVSTRWHRMVHELVLEFLGHRKYDSNEVLSHFCHESELDLEKNILITSRTVAKFTRLEKLNISGMPLVNLTMYFRMLITS
jgi:hypothetical protein